MPSSSWFIFSLLCLNLGACVAFVSQSNWPWALVYLGAALIQAGCWWLSR